MAKKEETVLDEQATSVSLGSTRPTNDALVEVYVIENRKVLYGNKVIEVKVGNQKVSKELKERLISAGAARAL